MVQALAGGADPAATPGVVVRDGRRTRRRPCRRPAASSTCPALVLARRLDRARIATITTASSARPTARAPRSRPRAAAPTAAASAPSCTSATTTAAAALDLRARGDRPADRAGRRPTSTSSTRSSCRSGALLEALVERPVAFGVQTRIDLWKPELLELLGARRLRLDRGGRRERDRAGPRDARQELPHEHRGAGRAPDLRQAPRALRPGQPARGRERRRGAARRLARPRCAARASGPTTRCRCSPIRARPTTTRASARPTSGPGNGRIAATSRPSTPSATSRRSGRCRWRNWSAPADAHDPPGGDAAPHPAGRRLRRRGLAVQPRAGGRPRGARRRGGPGGRRARADAGAARRGARRSPGCGSQLLDGGLDWHGARRARSLRRCARSSSSWPPREDVDLVHLNGAALGDLPVAQPVVATAAFLPRHLVAGDAAGRSRCREPWRWHRARMAAGLAAAAAVIVPSAAFAAQLRQAYGARIALDVVHNGRTPRFAPRAPRRQAVVLTAGRLVGRGQEPPHPRCRGGRNRAGRCWRPGRRAAGRAGGRPPARRGARHARAARAGRPAAAGRRSSPRWRSTSRSGSRCSRRRSRAAPWC